jgi:hypothetical protein
MTSLSMSLAVLAASASSAQPCMLPNRPKSTSLPARGRVCVRECACVCQASAQGVRLLPCSSVAARAAHARVPHTCICQAAE